MSIYRYEGAFGAWDVTSRAMRKALETWQRLYYDDTVTPEKDPCQRIAYAVVTKICKTVFGEYKAASRQEAAARLIAALDAVCKETMQLALVEGECYLKPCPVGEGFAFRPVARHNVLIFGRDATGCPTDMGMVEESVRGSWYFTLLERRRLDENGCLVLTHRLYRSRSRESLGSPVGLEFHPDYKDLPQQQVIDLGGSLGLVRIKTPMLGCVEPGPEPVAVYAAAAGLIENIDRNEAQLSGEFSRGESRILLSADLMDRQRPWDRVFVALDDDPENAGMTVFAPQLREQSYLARKQEYLRNVESIVGLKRGLLSDANTEDRTATEIASSAGDYNLTIMDFQRMWEDGLREALRLCVRLAGLYGLPVPDGAVDVDWGNGVLYDEDKTWAEYKAMVAAGLLKPEIALAWRFNMASETAEDLARVRERLMPGE